jgi:hypothetical protein
VSTLISLEKTGTNICIFGEATNDSEGFIKIELSAFETGLISKLKSTNFTVLLTIYSFMDEEKNFKRTLKEISERSGVSIPTVKRSINELKDYQLDGKLLLPISFY